METFYSSLVFPIWFLGYFALRPVAADEVLPFNEQGEFTCPVSGETFRRGDAATPAWPRFPMGFTWSVELATDLAHAILRQVAPSGAESLNIEKNAELRRSAVELFFRTYIDNLYIFFGEFSISSENA